MMIEDGPMTTSGATSAVLSYVLRLVARVAGEELAQQTARILLLDPDRQSQAPYISQALRQKPRHSLGERIENLLQQSLDQPLSVASLAERAGTSERSLLRHFRAQFGVTPQEHLQRLRVERAKALLETTRLSFDEIVERCGYADSASFRKLFKRATSLTPSDYRERFRLRPH
jgi:transcriptional regulator GlxA family with amidase domain